MRWPAVRRREISLQHGSRKNTRVLELEMAMEILGEVFGIKSCEVEEMIRNRLKERPLYDREFHLDQIS
ncbi:MAG: hypothetical protein QUS09_03915 [Methanotrichaceae archaeon]|nr:hypothetical protein [Methanotrichaceae archaeon]